MRGRIGTSALWAGGCVLLAAPTFAAFRSGGYGVKTQLILAAACATLLAVAVLSVRWPPLPGGLPLLAVAALVALALWTAASVGWAAVRETAVHDTDRVAMYCVAFMLALAVMRVRAIRRAAPAVLLAGILAVCLYALAGRLLPDLVHERSNAVRLSQPLTYWNALGLFAGFGTLIGVALAGDRTRTRPWRAAACAAAVPCGLASILTLSRGALAAVLAGLAVCALLRGTRATLVAAACPVGGLIVLGAALSLFPDVRSAGGHRAAQVAQGAGFLPILVAVTVAVGVAFSRLSRRRASMSGLPGDPRSRAAAAIVVVLLVLGAGVAVAGQSTEGTDVPRTASRIARVETDRGHYWRVALSAFGRHPINGTGTSSFAVDWMRERGGDQPALDAHSLYVETLAELGIVGAILLLAFLGSLALGTLRAARAAPRDPTALAAAGVLAAFLVHAALDWDWEMPAVTLIPLILSAAALRTRERRPDGPT
jgi:hypothetical protein